MAAALTGVQRSQPALATAPASAPAGTRRGRKDHVHAGRRTWSPEPDAEVAEGHSHGRPVDIKEFFRPEDLASLTEQIVLSSESSGGDAADAQRVQLEVERLHDPGLPGELVRGGGTPGRPASSPGRRPADPPAPYRCPAG
jgi:hypothetical protein